MGIDLELVAAGASLYLDRGYPLRGMASEAEGGQLFTGDDIRIAFDCDRYGFGWVDAVAAWVDEFGPAELLNDHEHSDRLTAVYTAWTNGEGHRMFDVAKAGGRWIFYERK
jgi:hypothetical protein